MKKMHRMNFIWLPVFYVLFLRTSKTLAEDSPPQIYNYPAFDEPCPTDSISIEGICRCDHTLCNKPPCPIVLTQVTNATNTPGSCCPTYSCEGCLDEDKLDGKCPCLPGATIQSGRNNKCECVDPHKTIKNGTCVCDQDKCELPDLCDERSVQVKDVVGCCEKVKCVTCPDDSYPTSNSNLVIEDKCVCFPCPPMKCEENQRPDILRRGKNFPGMCCDIYNCVDIDPNKGCVVNGTIYAEGETWNSPGDDKCKCENGISFCSPNTNENDSFRSCLSGGKVYKHLDTWVEDTCTNCTCKDGESKCIAHLCDVHTSEVKKPAPGCPPLTTCKKVCEYGFKLNRQGCEICKCKPSDKMVAVKDKYVQLDVLLKEHNLTETDVINLIKNSAQGDARLSNALEDNASPTTTSTTTTTATIRTTTTTGTTTSTAGPSTTICFTDKNSSHGDCTYSCILEYAIPGFIVGTIFGGVLLFTFLKCSEKNHQKYKMAYTYKPVGKETVDKNLNFSPIIKTKNLELQSYNEKKNVI